MKRILVINLLLALTISSLAQSVVVGPSFDQHSGRLAGYDYSPRRSSLATISDDQSLRVWKVKGDAVYLDARVDFPTEPGTRNGILTCCKFHPLADYVLVGASRGENRETLHQPYKSPFFFYIVNPWNEGDIKIVDRKGDVAAPITSFAFSPDTRLLAVVSSFEHVLLYDADTFTLLEDICLLDEFVGSASFPASDELRIETDLYERKYSIKKNNSGHFISCERESQKRVRKGELWHDYDEKTVPETLLEKTVYRPGNPDPYKLSKPVSFQFFPDNWSYSKLTESILRYKLDGIEWRNDAVIIPYSGLPYAKVGVQNDILHIMYHEEKYTFSYVQSSIMIEKSSSAPICSSFWADALKGRYSGDGNMILRINKGDIDGFITTPYSVMSVASGGKDSRYIVASLCDGTIRWYDTEQMKEVLSLFIAKDGRWFFSLPNGFYCYGGNTDSTSDDFIEWKHQENNSVIVSRPKDLKRRESFLSERRVKEALDMIYKDSTIRDDVYADYGVLSSIDNRNLYPSVSIDSVYKKNGFSFVDFSVKNYDPKRYGPYSLTFEVDDAPIPPSAYNVVSRKGGKMTLSLDSEKALNQLYVSLKSSEWNYQTSDGYKPGIPYLFTISCGISDYSTSKDRLPSLKSPINDASDFDGEAGSMFGRRVDARENYKLLGASVKTDSLKHYLGKIRNLSADENQVVMFYYSGHGDRADSSWVLKSLSEDISGESIISMLSEIPGYKIIVLDACYSGMLAVNPREDMAIITSSGAGEHSLDGYMNDKSPFTKELIAKFQETVKDGGRLTVQDLCRYVTEWKIEVSRGKYQNPEGVSGSKISTLMIYQ